jgi:GxxExxY protein
VNQRLARKWGQEYIGLSSSCPHFLAKNRPMPITCGMRIEPLTTEQFAALDYRVMSCAYTSQNQIGRLADERIYKASLAHQLQQLGLSCSRQVPIDIEHKTFRKTYFLDAVVDSSGVYELKTVAQLTGEHVSQLLTYLYLLDLPRGKLINFRSTKVEAQFVNAPLTASTRRAFAVEHQGRNGTDYFVELVLDMLRDLGTALSLSLYQEIMVHLLGGEESAVAMIPLSEGDTSFGNQRFYLANSTESFHITCFQSVTEQYEQHLQSLLQLSPLNAMHWVNIDVKCVNFKTVLRKQ